MTAVLFHSLLEHAPKGAAYVADVEVGGGKAVVIP